MDEIASLVRHLPAGEGRKRTLTFISPNAGEGTTTCAANFAKYLADGAGAKVLLVDVNLRHPSVHDIASVERSVGMTELLTDAATISQAVKPTRIPMLHVITGGGHVDNAYRLLLPDAVREHVLDRAIDYDFVILDSAPVNPYFESLGVAALCDGVILVVEGERTRRQPAKIAKTQLEQANCRLLGVVINKRKFYIPKALYQRL